MHFDGVELSITYLHVVSKSSTLVGNANELFCMTSCIITRHFSNVCIEHFRISCLFVRALFQRNRIARFGRTCWLAKLAFIFFSFSFSFSVVIILRSEPSVVIDCSRAFSDEMPVKGAHQNIAVFVPVDKQKERQNHYLKVNILLSTLRFLFYQFNCLCIYLLLFFILHT